MIDWNSAGRVGGGGTDVTPCAKHPFIPGAVVTDILYTSGLVLVLLYCNCLFTPLPLPAACL